MANCNALFTLPEINIIGGDYIELPIYIFDKNSGDNLDVADLQLDFAIIDYKNRNGRPIFTKSGEGSSVDPKLFTIYLNSEDTKMLSGQFIYQYTVKAPNDKMESFQGIMVIDRNINPDSFSSSIGE